MREIGKEVKYNIRKDRRAWKAGNIIDFGTKVPVASAKVISQEELYTPNSETTLDWESLADIRQRDGHTIHICDQYGVEGLLCSLIEPLVEKGEFSKQMKKGFWYLIGAGGIEVYDGSGTDPMTGRNIPTEAYFYPKREADAIAYAKHFFIDSRPIRPALMGLVANINWKE